MTHRTIWAFVIFLATSSLLADRPPTIAELQQLLDDKKYSAAVSYANRLLVLKGDAAAGVDRAQTEVLKGTAQLSLKSFPQAADSFAAAVKEGSDPQLMAEDKATEILIRRSHRGIYTPKQASPDGTKLPPINIMDAKNRNETTFATLFADELATAKPKLTASKTVHSMPQLLATIDLAMTLRAIELTATGKDDQTKAQLTQLATHAQSLVTTALKTMDQRVTDIQTSANTLSIYYDQVKDPYAPNGLRTTRRTRKNGLTNRNISELQDTVATCAKIGPATDELSKASDAVTGWEALTANSTRISSRAGDVLNADYSNGSP